MKSRLIDELRLSAIVVVPNNLISCLVDMFQLWKSLEMVVQTIVYAGGSEKLPTLGLK